MSDEQRSISTGTVIAIGFIVLGLLNLFSVGFYHKTYLNSHSRFPGILLASIGVIIIIIRTIKKNRDRSGM